MSLMAFSSAKKPQSKTRMEMDNDKMKEMETCYKATDSKGFELATLAGAIAAHAKLEDLTGLDTQSYVNDINQNNKKRFPKSKILSLIKTQAHPETTAETVMVARRLLKGEPCTEEYRREIAQALFNIGKLHQRPYLSGGAMEHRMTLAIASCHIVANISGKVNSQKGMLPEHQLNLLSNFIQAGITLQDLKYFMTKNNVTTFDKLDPRTLEGMKANYVMMAVERCLVRLIRIAKGADDDLLAGFYGMVQALCNECTYSCCTLFSQEVNDQNTTGSNLIDFGITPSAPASMDEITRGLQALSLCYPNLKTFE